MAFVVNPYRYSVSDPFASESLLATLTTLGLTSNLQLCLDFRKITGCYTSGQTIEDLNNVTTDLTRGADSGASSDDPTFNDDGEFSADSNFEFDGGDLIRCGALDAWQDTLHKNNAVATIMYVHWLPVTHGNGYVFYTATGAAGMVGVRLNPAHVAADTTEFTVRKAAGQAAAFNSTTANVESAWNFNLLSFDESVGAGGGFWNINGTNDSTFDSTYTTPDATGADDPLTIGSDGNMSGGFLDNGSKIGAMAVWTSALTTTNATAIYNAMDGVYNFGS